MSISYLNDNDSGLQARSIINDLVDVANTVYTGSYTGSFTGSLHGTASYAYSSSYALTASVVLEGSQNAVYATNAGTAETASYFKGGYVASLSSTDTRIQISGSSTPSATGSLNIRLNMTGSNFSQNGQIVAFINGLANLY